MNPIQVSQEIDPRIYSLYDEYCHGAMDRREFLAKAGALVVGGMAMAQALFPRYANAQTISFTDPRIKASYVKYASPGGSSGEMRGYLVQPVSTAPTKFPAVLVIHENRGLNPYIEDVARRLAAAGFLALAPAASYNRYTTVTVNLLKKNQIHPTSHPSTRCLPATSAFCAASSSIARPTGVIRRSIRCRLSFKTAAL
jgi:hypothetical protein